MPAHSLTDEFLWSARSPAQRRLERCCVFSALVIYGGLAFIHLPLRFDHNTRSPATIDVRLLQEEPSPVAKEREEQPVREATPLAAEPPASTETREAGASSLPQEATETSPSSSPHERPMDWYGTLERVSAEKVGESAETDSLHPEFDELRRIAATRYAEPRTGKPPPIWENVEKDVLGRTLLRHGDCFRVLDDPSVINRYAFETFERFVVFCETAGDAPAELPWVKEIKSRYPYLRESGGAAQDEGATNELPAQKR